MASAVANGTLEFRLDSPGGTLIAAVTVGNTGGWQSWQTITAPVAGAAGLHKLFVVFKNAASNLNWFQFASSAGTSLPVPWLTADIGAVGQAGSAGYSAGTFTVTGSGADIEGTADAFRSVYQTIGPNGEIRARVVNVQGTDPWAKAGVMIREGLASNAVNAAMVVTASNGVEFQRRIIAGGGTSSTVVSGALAPQWVRLVRSATNSFSGYYSADGTNWNQVGTNTSIPLGNNALAGMAVTAHNNGLLNVSTFDRVTLNQPPSLAAIPDRALIAGATLTFTNAATDPDIPAESFAFSLLNPPGGATIDSSTGVFSWRPTIAQSPSTQLVSVIVADSGLPTMSATQNFTVTVLSPTRPVLNSVVLTNGSLSCLINGDSGPDYNVQTSTNLSSWSLVSNYASPMVPFFFADTNPATSPRRFYRVVLGP